MEEWNPKGEKRMSSITTRVSWEVVPGGEGGAYYRSTSCGRVIEESSTSQRRVFEESSTSHRRIFNESSTISRRVIDESSTSRGDGSVRVRSVRVGSDRPVVLIGTSIGGTPRLWRILRVGRPSSGSYWNLHWWVTAIMSYLTGGSPRPVILTGTSIGGPPRLCRVLLVGRHGRGF